MTLEAKLDTLIEINQALLTHFQSQAALGTAAFVSGSASEEAEKATRTRRTKKQIEEDAAADAAAKAAAGKTEDTSAKNEQVATATTTQATASTEPSATAQQATASASPTREWKEVIEAFTKLMAAPDHGRVSVVQVLKHFDKTAEKVPALEALGKNAEIIAHIEAILAPAATAAEEDPMAALGL